MVEMFTRQKAAWRFTSRRTPHNRSLRRGSLASPRSSRFTHDAAFKDKFQRPVVRVAATTAPAAA